MSETRVLADFVANTNFEDLPPPVVENAKERVGDIIACGYVVTMVLLGEPTGPNWYREELLSDPKVRALQHKVKLVEDPVATKNFFPGYKTPSTVEITMKDGSRYSKTVEYPKGEPENPFTRQDHIDKLTNMALWTGLKQGQIAELIETIDSLDRLSHISELTRLLVP